MNFVKRSFFFPNVNAIIEPVVPSAAARRRVGGFDSGSAGSSVVKSGRGSTGERLGSLINRHPT